MARYFAFAPVDVVIRDGSGPVRGTPATIGFEAVSERDALEPLTAAQFARLKDPRDEGFNFLNQPVLLSTAHLVENQVGIPVRLPVSVKKNKIFLYPEDELVIAGVHGPEGLHYVRHCIK